MGDNFLKQQVRNFKKGKDRASDESSRRKLFEHPELVRTAYPVSEVNGTPLNIGDVLLAIPSPVEGRVDLALGTRHVGISEGDAAKSLRSALTGPNGPGGPIACANHEKGAQRHAGSAPRHRPGTHWLPGNRTVCGSHSILHGEG